MDHITIIIERPCHQTGNRYSATVQLVLQELDARLESRGEAMARAVTKLLAEIDAKETVVRKNKPRLP
jgi:hypothetical protein